MPNAPVIDMLQENMIDAWKDRAKRAGQIVEAALKAPALTDPLYANAAGHYYQRSMVWAGYWMQFGGR